MEEREVVSYSSNSHKSREQEAKKNEKKKVEAIVQAKVKKKNIFEKVVGPFIETDGKSVGSYIFADVLVPAIKKGLYDVCTNAVEMLLYGEANGRRRSLNSSSNSRTSYTSYYERDKRPSEPVRSRSIYSYDEVIFETRMDAEAVLQGMDDILDEYQVVSVADYYELASIKGNYTDNNYGWTTLTNAQIVRVSGGYMLKLPKAMPL